MHTKRGVFGALRAVEEAFSSTFAFFLMGRPDGGIGHGGTTKTYTYSTSNELEAGYKIIIEGTYTEAVGVNLTGTITGATYQGCYVLANNGTTATLLSPNEMAVGKARSQFADDEEMTEAIGGIIGSTAIENISGWRLPTLAELNSIYSASETVNGLLESDGGTILTNARKKIGIVRPPEHISAPAHRYAGGRTYI